ncbi:MAG: hypothetical protein JKY50_00085 [Oleispira sp.]|nr:hypothetical protein [Oleispira sp.]
MSTIFEEQIPVVQEGELNTGGNQSSFMDQLVGDGKKFKTVEDLAKGKAESDKMIEELLAKQSQEDYSKQLLEKIKEQATVVPVAPEPKDTNINGEGNTSPKPEDIESLLDTMLNKRDKDTLVRSNLNEVQTRLISLYGTEAQAKVKAKAETLGVPVSYLDEMASNSPSSFFTIMGEAQKASPNPIIEGTQNPTQNSTTENDAAHYYKMYKENRNLWKSQAMQKQMVADKNRLGERFFK